MIIPELFVLEVDLCIKVVALNKITTVDRWIDVSFLSIDIKISELNKV